MKLVINHAKEAADREALSTVLAQQRLIKMLERQRNAEAEKSKLLESEVLEIRAAYQQVSLNYFISDLSFIILLLKFLFFAIYCATNDNRLLMK